MSAKEKTLSLRWLILVIVVIAAGLALWLHYKAGSQDPRTRKYTKQEWLQMVTRREHQPIATWKGIDVGRIRKDGTSHSYDGLAFGDTPARVLEHQYRDLLEQEPLAFLPLFDSKDPGVILTGVYIYRRSPAFVENLSSEDKSQVAAAFRKLLGHDDVRMRFTGIQTLGERGWLTVDDVERGFDDETLSVRVVTAWRVEALTENQPHLEKLVVTKRKLAPVLLVHLNDTYFIVRSQVSTMFRDLFKRPVATGRGSSYELAPTFPAKIDWVRADWHTREKTQKEWKTWWAEHGEEALRWAHPPQ